MEKTNNEVVAVVVKFKLGKAVAVAVDAGSPVPNLTGAAVDTELNVEPKSQESIK